MRTFLNTLCYVLTLVVVDFESAVIKSDQDLASTNPVAQYLSRIYIGQYKALYISKDDLNRRISLK